MIDDILQHNRPLNNWPHDSLLQFFLLPIKHMLSTPYAMNNLHIKIPYNASYVKKNSSRLTECDYKFEFGMWWVIAGHLFSYFMYCQVSLCQDWFPGIYSKVLCIHSALEVMASFNVQSVKSNTHGRTVYAQACFPPLR